MQVFDENGKFLDLWPLKSPHWPASQNTLMVNHFIGGTNRPKKRHRRHRLRPSRPRPFANRLG